jgi:hypothetical protein
MRSACRVLSRKSEGKIKLITQRHRWEENIKINPVCRKGVDWIYFAQDMDQWPALVNTVIAFGPVCVCIYIKRGIF